MRGAQTYRFLPLRYAFRENGHDVYVSFMSKLSKLSIFKLEIGQLGQDGHWT